ncbi:restriction endonuclease [Marinimicrobium alkaliphilum]|uniref:restriction endonuclease n=1 Tax=Marinimicrobium alkaliphilum TaxID=2202654 RepID=UPI000DB96A1C|nr:restriction endonuclease [Marinimicrobium alkaliphilum]
MSSLGLIDKQKLERELGMSSGYVLNFSNRTFDEFFREIVGVSIFDSFYDQASGSKAHRTRAFWRLATDVQVLKFLNGLLEGWEIYADQSIPGAAEKHLKQIIRKLEGAGESGVRSSEEETKVQIDQNLSQRLLSQLIELSELTPQSRGFAFERFLKTLFDAYGLSARSSFRTVGEQIDGSFVLNNETYLLEAKWQNAPTGAGDLHTFEGKIGQKALWSRGLFLSNSGFSSDGLQAFGKGKRIVCMDGLDLYEMLNRRLSVTDILEAKVRRAAETGRPFIPLRELFI